MFVVAVVLDVVLAALSIMELWWWWWMRLEQGGSLRGVGDTMLEVDVVSTVEPRE
jgi:hypothetical protein